MTDTKGGVHYGHQETQNSKEKDREETQDHQETPLVFENPPFWGGFFYSLFF